MFEHLQSSYVNNSLACSLSTRHNTGSTSLSGELHGWGFVGSALATATLGAAGGWFSATLGAATLLEASGGAFSADDDGGGGG